MKTVTLAYLLGSVALVGVFAARASAAGSIRSHRSSLSQHSFPRITAISFQIRIGTMPEGNKLGLIAREIDDRDVPRAKLVLGQLRARNLPIAAAVFAERLARVLEGMRDEGAVMLAAAAPA